MTLGSLIPLAYGPREFQMVAGADWVDTERFDIQARDRKAPWRAKLPDDFNPFSQSGSP